MTAAHSCITHTPYLVAMLLASLASFCAGASWASFRAVRDMREARETVKPDPDAGDSDIVVTFGDGSQWRCPADR